MKNSHIVEKNLANARKLPVNIPLLFREKAKNHPNIVFQAAKDKKGVFQYYSYKTVYEDIVTLAAGLKKLGVQKYNHVALIADNRREWMITDLAILSLGAADVPRGSDSTGNEIRYIISFSECSVGVFENMTQLKKVLESVGEVPLLKKVILFDDFTEENKDLLKKVNIDLYSFDCILNLGKESTSEELKTVESIADTVIGDDLATIIFTSGTTGTPKGVMLTHRNYTAQLEVVHDILTVKPGDMWLSVLPVWHSFERTMQYIAIVFASGLAYSKPVASIMLADMAVIRPQWMCGVPRLWEALAQGVYRSMKKEGGVKLALFNFFVGVGKRFTVAKEHVCGHICQFEKRSRFLDFCKGIIPLIVLAPLDALGNAIIYKKIRAKLGGRIVAAISGGGALQPHIDLFYRAIKLKLLEGYGITEAGPVLSVRDLHTPRPGCVGVIFPSATMKVVAEKEGVITSSDGLPPGEKGLILAKGDQIMKGYYKRDDLTKEVIDEDGWFNTGDLGMLTYDNEIKITGRAKDTIVLLGGENIEPLAIEKALTGSDYIETAVVLGQDKKYLSALIVVTKDAILSYAKENEIIYDQYESLAETPEIYNLVKSEIESQITVENGFRSCDHIYKFTILTENFKIAKELSAKQELMRHKVNEIYKDKIALMFD